MSRRRVTAVVALLACGFARTATAHNPDTSYAWFAVNDRDLEAKFSYDLTTLNLMVPGLDADGDRRITREELLHKVPAVYDFLRRHVALEIDFVETPWGADMPVGWPPDAGEAVAEVDYHSVKASMLFGFTTRHLAPIPDFRVEFKFFDRVGPRHNVLGSFKQGGKVDEVILNRFEPSWLHDTGYKSPDRATHAPPDASARSNVNASLWSQLVLFFKLGVEHIFIGYDHILFLLALILVSRFWDLVKIVTSFTVAHTITLILATLEVVNIPGRLVETAIAATIVYTALENFWIERTDRRWLLTFAFGLIHGFGFAGVLRELGLPTTGLVRCLISFNLGVEAGQLAIVSLLWLPVAALGNRRHGRIAKLALSALVALFGLGWFLDRALGFTLMPF